MMTILSAMMSTTAIPMATNLASQKTVQTLRVTEPRIILPAAIPKLQLHGPFVWPQISSAGMLEMLQNPMLRCREFAVRPFSQTFHQHWYT
jgi:hypothetical protein